MKTRSTVISNPSDLNALNSFPFARKRGIGKISLAENFQHEEREELEKQLNKYYYACGCSTSSKWLISGLILGGVLTIAGNYISGFDTPNALLTVTGLGLAGAISGKILGLVKANSNLKRCIHTIQAFWRPKGEPMREKFTCG
jgi:hypothetical protein